MPNTKRATIVRQSVTLEAVRKAVSEHYGVAIEELSRPGCDLQAIRIRRTAAWLARTMTDATTPQVVEAFGLGQGGAMRRAYIVVERRRYADQAFREETDLLKQVLKNE